MVSSTVNTWPVYIVAVDHITDSTVLTFNILGYNIIKFKDLIIILCQYSCAAMGCAAIYGEQLFHDGLVLSFLSQS